MTLENQTTASGPTETTDFEPRHSSDMEPKPERKEGSLTKMIESCTSKISSGSFLTAALGAVAASAALQVMGAKDKSQFVGHWVPTILILGLYNKLVKLEGSEG